MDTPIFMHRWCARICWLIAAITIFFAAASVYAEALPWTLNRYQHTAWTAKDGAPTGVYSLVQTPDGFLWIGAAQGLFRFDGVHFKHIENVGTDPLAALPIVDMYAQSDGTLWFTYQFGGLYRIKSNQLTQFGPKDGGPSRTSIQEFTQDQHGQMWAIAAGNVHKFDGKKWIWPKDEFADVKQNGENISYLLFDRHGDTWVGTVGSLFYRAATTSKFVMLEHKGEVHDIKQLSDGSVWVRYLKGSVEQWKLHANMPALEPGSLSTLGKGALQFDNQGGLWVTTFGKGVTRFIANAIGEPPSVKTLGDHVETFDSSNGLSGDGGDALLKDREGNIWVGTGGGIDRFSRSDFTPASFLRGTSAVAITTGLHNTIWAGSMASPAMEIDGSQLKTLDVPPGVVSAFSDGEGNIYMAGYEAGGIWKISESGAKFLTKFPQPFGISVYAITKDLNNVLWVAFEGLKWHGVYTWSNGQWAPVTAGRNNLPVTLYTDFRGRVWTGYLNDPKAGEQISVADAGKLTLYGRQQGVTIGDVTAFAEDAQRLWVGGSDGFGYIDGAGLKVLQLVDAQSIRNITGLVFAANGDLWFHTLSGVYQIPSSEVRQAERNASYEMNFRKFDQLDGLPGEPLLFITHPTVVKSTDGRLWFATINGVVWLEPTQTVFNSVPPPVVITSISADGKDYAPSGSPTLPALTNNIRFSFAAPSLTMPERVQVKIRLLGVDKDWRDVGAQREISYSNLVPKSYQFDVIAANNDGVWNKAGASLRFSIAPAFYQTRWFMALCIGMGLILLWLLFIWRLRQLNHRVRIELEVRHAERESIARDLHDTLLQSFPASLLQIQSGVDKVSNVEEREYLSHRLDHAYQIVTESRDKVANLRMEQTSGLVSMLSIVAFEQARDFNILPEIVVRGRPRPINDNALEQVSFVAREAMLNACKHSRGKTVKVTIEFGSRALSIRIQDNGTGLDTALLKDGTKAGHWGLKGMRERADLISARISFSTPPTGGTLVELRVPGHKAYRRPSLFHRWTTGYPLKS